MAELPPHGNAPLGRVALLPQPSNDDERSERKREPMDSWKGESAAARPSSETHCGRPAEDVAALLKKIRAHPEAERILGNSLIPVVALERLSFRSLMHVQPVTSRPELHHISLHQPLQTHHQPEVHILDFMEDSHESELAFDLSQAGTTSIICSEPICPEDFPCQDPDQPGYILFDSGPDEWYLGGDPDSETFYLDPDSEQTVVLHVDPDQRMSLQLEDDTKCEVVVADLEESEKLGGCLLEEEEEEEEEEECEPSIIHQPGPGDGAAEVESEDFCAVCLNGGDLLCCDACPKVYHLACHVPTLSSFPLGDWVCTLCRSDQEPEETCVCESIHGRGGGGAAPYSLSLQVQRRCEKLTLLLLCHLLSAPFHEPVSRLARNYYQIIKRPVDLSLIRRKLEGSGALRYFSAQHFVDDVLLMFRNCATFNYPDSDVAQAGRNLQQFFFTKLREIFPERAFPSAAEHREDAVRLQWLNRKRTENYRKGRRHVFHGKNPFI